MAPTDEQKVIKELINEIKLILGQMENAIESAALWAKIDSNDKYIVGVDLCKDEVKRIQKELLNEIIADFKAHFTGVATIIGCFNRQKLFLERLEERRDKNG